jgi:DNA-binding CsgD family transcriptional regulator
MVSRSNHYNARYRFDLSPRQREVLELIAAGRTNAEIAEMLGITLDGAKWHVREILAKLEVESREEAAAAWRGHNQPSARLWRALSGIALHTTARWIAVSVVGGAAIAGGAALYMALRSDGSDPGRTQPAATVAPVAAAPDAALPACDGSQIVMGMRAEPMRGPTLITVEITNNGTACLDQAGLTVRVPALPGARQPDTTAVYFPRWALSPGPQSPVRLMWFNGCALPDKLAVSAGLAGISAWVLDVSPPLCTDPNTGPSLFPLAKLDGVAGCAGSPPVLGSGAVMMFGTANDALPPCPPPSTGIGVCVSPQIAIIVSAQGANGSVVLTVDITNKGADCVPGALLLSIPDSVNADFPLSGVSVVPEPNYLWYYFEDGPLPAGAREQKRFAWTNNCAPQGPSRFFISVMLAGARDFTLTSASPPCERPNDPPSLRPLPLQSAGSVPLE